MKYPSFPRALRLFMLMACISASASAYTIQSQWGSLATCDTATKGLYIVWWDKTQNHAAEAYRMLDSMDAYRTRCLSQYGMQDPPNAAAGHYFNVYLKFPGDIFPTTFGNYMGTDVYGLPYTCTSTSLTTDWINIAHETFHHYQSGATSPGFAYTGDGSWYSEATAHWFAFINNSNSPVCFNSSDILVQIPQVPLWLGWTNLPANYPDNWQTQVHQYAMSLFLYYLTEHAGVPRSLVSGGFYAGTALLPQEYLYDQIGAAAFRSHFLSWAAHIANGLDLLTPAQAANAHADYTGYADHAYDHQYIATFHNTGSGGWYTPVDSLTTTPWSFNTYRLTNTSAASYTFELSGSATGTTGGPAFFGGKVIVMNSLTGAAFYDLGMSSSVAGSRTINVTPGDTAMYYVVASMPPVFSGMSQLIHYNMRITKGTTAGVQSLSPQAGQKEEMGRYNTLGQLVNADSKGLVIIRYRDGSAEQRFIAP